MNPIEVLNAIRQAGGRAIVEAGDLQISCPPGTLTPEEAACLREHKADLVRILAPADEERSALQWIECLSPAKADAVLSKARKEWGEIVSFCATVDEADPWPPLAAGDQPTPCVWCDSLEAWQDMTGRWHCATCDPPRKALRLLKRAKMIRQRYSKAEVDQ